MRELREQAKLVRNCARQTIVVQVQGLKFRELAKRGRQGTNNVVILEPDGFQLRKVAKSGRNRAFQVIVAASTAAYSRRGRSNAPPKELSPSLDCACLTEKRKNTVHTSKL